MHLHLIKKKEFFIRVLEIMLPVALQQAINMGVNMLDTPSVPAGEKGHWKKARPSICSA